MKNACWFILLTFIILSSCRKNELEQVVPYNPLDTLSGVEIFQIDSVKINQNPTRINYYFKIKYELIKDTSRINNVVVYRNGGLRFHLSSKQRISFTDINVAAGVKYKYQLALRDKNFQLTKLSQPHETTP